MKRIMNMLTYIGEQGYIAFGDADNDYEMLKHAELSVAMGNASPKLREISSFVTAKAEEDGILKGVKQLMTTVCPLSVL